MIRSVAPHGAFDPKEPTMNDSNRFDAAAGLLRAGLGAMFIAHALLKYFVFTLPGTAQFFESLGLPGFLGYATFAAELVGGAMLVLGVYTRTVAAVLVPVLLGATWAHVGNGWLFTAPKGGWEYPAFLTLAAIVVALQGGGRYTLGALLGTAGAPLRTATGHA
jgi:putative oxidoreductase